MVDPIEHPETAARIRNETADTSVPETPASPRASATPTAHTVGRPSDIPRGGRGPLAAWLGIPLLLAILLAAVYWLLPALHSNDENKTDPVHGMGDGRGQR